LDFDPVQAQDGSLEIRDPADPDRVIAVMPRNGFWFDQIYFPLAEAKTYQDIDNLFPWEVISDEEVAWLSRGAKRLHEGTDRAILAAFGGNLFEGGHFDFGYQRFMELLAMDRDLAEYYIDKKADNWVEMLKRYLPAVKDYVHVIQVGDDLGMQTGPQISPRMYRELFKPYYERIYSYIRENSDLYIFLHSCGGFYELISDLIEIGVQILNPVQTSAAGMDPVRLKKEFGDNLTFWGGGLDTQHTLIGGSLEDIRREVREMIDIFAPGGGFVFTQIHNIQQEVSPDRVMAIYDTAQEYGRYPLRLG
jgi:uroporphyrinogen decarboxylase